MATLHWQSDDARIVLWQGDCREVMAGLADKSIDHVITDPPYSEHVHGKHRIGHRRSPGDREDRSADGVSRTKELGFDALSPELRQACAAHFARLAQRWSLAFSDLESCHLWRGDLVGAGLDYVRTVLWHKLGCTPQFTGDRPAVAHETITVCHPKGRKRWNGGGKHGMYAVPIVLQRSGQDEERLHTTQKPLRLIRQLVADFTDPGDVILDPFAGSGTTLVAAMEQGRRAIGVELNTKNADAAAARLATMARQGLLFDTAAGAR